MTTKLILCTAPLIVPATRPERFAKAAASGTDAVIIDLEDSVASYEKVAARDVLRTAKGSFIVRINGSNTPWFADDVAACKALGVAAIMLPKVGSIEEIERLNLLSNNIPIIALVESAVGLANARGIAASGVARLAFGSLDFAVDLGCAHEPDALLFARSELVMASRLAGIAAPLDGVTVAMDDTAILLQESRRAASLGFAGKLCIHPKQIETVLVAFQPSKDEIAWAKKIMIVADDGVANVGGTMVDAPVQLRAQRILSRL